MDLSFARSFGAPATERVTVLPTDLAVLLVGVAARQAASRTARAQARLALQVAGSSPLAPASGAFDAVLAAWLRVWRAHERGVYPSD